MIESIQILSLNNNEILTGDTYTIYWSVNLLNYPELIIQHLTNNNVAPINKDTSYKTTILSQEPSKLLITSNLGSDIENINGWYWQFNNKQGYLPNFEIFYLRTPDTEWQKIEENSNWNDINDPCLCELGENWRIPTIEEWINISKDWQNSTDGLNSNLKLQSSGMIMENGEQLYQYGWSGRYWSKDQENLQYAYYLDLNTETARIYSNNKSNGFTIRCIKNIEVKIEYSINNGVDWIFIDKKLAISNPNSNYNWNLPLVYSELCLIKISDANNPNIFSISNLFSILK